MFEANKEYRFVGGPQLIPANPAKVKLLKKLDGVGTWKAEYIINRVVRRVLVNEWMLKN